jgi:PKD repeat protein
MLMSAAPVAAASTYPTLTVVVHRVQAMDDMDFWSSVSTWVVHVGVMDADEWSWKTYTGGTGNDATLDQTFTFTAHAKIVNLALIACDDDGGAGDDMADLSSDEGGGPDDNGCPMPASTLPVGAFLGTWDLNTGEITGDDLSTEQGWRKTSGDFDGSTGSDQNDASMWFSAQDDYALPTAAAGPDKSAFVSESVSIDGGASVTPGASVDEYAWDFQGDGTWDATGRIVSTTFTDKGPHTVTLKVTDSLGNSAQDTMTVTILNRAPVSSFESASPYSTSADDFAFTDGSTDADGTIASWAWDFGDGGAGTGKTTTHRFGQAGSYEVKLTVTDSDGGTNTTTRTVVVKPAGILGSAGGMAPEIQLGLVGAIALAAVVGVVMVARRKKRADPGEPLPPNAQPSRTDVTTQLPPTPPPPPTT